MGSQDPSSVSPAPSRLFLKGDQWKKCGRRVPRAELDVPAEVSVTVVFPGLSPDLATKRFGVRTLGELGCFCVLGEVPLGVATDHVVDVVLDLAGERFAFEGRVRYVDPAGIALEFVHPEERVRSRIRRMFEPQFLATSLAPLVSYTTVEPSATSTMIYSDGEYNNLQIGLTHTKISLLSLDLKVIGAHVEWRKTPRPDDAIAEPLSAEMRAKVLSFVRNLPGLDASFMNDIESIVGRMKFHKISPSE